MLLMRNSGLTRLEVSKARLDQSQVPTHAAQRFNARPVLLGVVGLLLVILALHTAVLAVFGLLLALLGAAVGLTIHGWLRRLDNGAQPVLMIREGLVRQGTVADLVAGDVLLVEAGDTLPVDVVGVSGQAPALLRRVLAWLQIDANGTIIAGSRATASGRAQVVATGDARLLLAQVLPALATRPARGTTARAIMFGLMQLVIGGLISGFRCLQRQAKQLRNSVTGTAMRTTIRRASLVGYARHAAKAAAFRYNQDPVSWASI